MAATGVVILRGDMTTTSGVVARPSIKDARDSACAARRCLYCSNWRCHAGLFVGPIMKDRVKNGNLGLAGMRWGVNVPGAGCTMIQRVIGTLNGRLMQNCTAIWLVSTLNHSSPHPFAVGRAMDEITGWAAQITNNTQEISRLSLLSTHAQCYHVLGFTNFTCGMRYKTSVFIG